MKKHFHTYQKILGLLPLLFFGLFTSLQAQDVFEFKIQYMAETNDSTWGVYVRPISDFPDGKNDAVTGSGQVTILMKNNGTDSIHNIQSVSGDWNTNYDIVRGPTEASDITYLFIGMRDGDGINYEDGEETLLFTFQVPFGCPDSLGLINNDTDPFNTLPNSVGNNPGMDLSVFNSSEGTIHNWEANYNPLAFSCGDCDEDGIVDGLEDTNGNGIDESDFMPPLDSSGICDVCDPNGINFFSATLSGGDVLTMCAAAGEDSVALFVTPTGGWSPFFIDIEEENKLTGEINTFTVSSYVVGDSIWVSPDSTSTYKMVAMRDSPPSLTLGGLNYCEINPDSLFEDVEIVVEGPLSIDNSAGGDPDNITACNLDTIGFGVHALNGGEGEILYQWQLSSDDTNWSDVADGTPYAFATTDSLIISNPLGLDGTYYRAKIYTPSCDTIYSMSAQLGIDGPFIIDVQPVDEAVCAKEDPVYFNTETSVGQGLFNRRWQVSVDTGQTWNDVAIGGIYSENNTTAPGGTGIQSIFYDTLFIDTASFDMDQWQYRIAAVGQNATLCNEIYTDAATLTVEGRLFIDVAPVDVAICSDTVACFGVTARNESPTGEIQYQWYVLERGDTDIPSNWTTISNDGTYSGTRSDTLCVTNPLGRDSFSYRVDIWTTECDIVTSSSSLLNIDGPVDFTVDALDVTVCAEEDPNYFAYTTSMGQGVLNTRWQISIDTGQTWDDLGIAGVYSTVRDSANGVVSGFERTYYDTLFIDTAIFSMNQYQYRLAAIGQNSNNCEDSYSEEVTLTVEGKIEVAVPPMDVFICSDTAACFGITATNQAAGVLEYQWYVLERGDADIPSNWTSISNDGTYSGTRSDTMCVTNVLGRDSFLYRVDISTSDCNIVTSINALLRVDGPIDFATSLQDVTVCAAEDATYFEAETTMGQGVVTTRWQVSTDTGQTWTNVVYPGAGNIYTNTSNTIANTTNPLIETSVFDTLFIDTASFFMNKWQYRIAAVGQNSNNCDDVYSREATLTVEGKLSVTVEPMDVEICSDTAACFGVSINNEAMEGNVLYQWYVKERGSNNWETLSSSDGSYGGVRADTMCVNFITGRDSFLYRVGIRTSDCNEIFSDSAILRVDGPIDFIGQPQDETVCAEEDVTKFTSVVTIGQGVMNTRWQVSEDDGSTWDDINDPSIYTTASDVQSNASVLIDSTYYDTLYLNNTIVAGMNGWRYRTVASGAIGSGCKDVPSNDAILTVEGKIAISVEPIDVVICSDTAACFGIEVTNETGEGVFSYQWQRQPPGETFWVNLSSSDGAFAGVRSDTLCVNNVTGLDSTLFRVLVSTDLCATDTSRSARLSVDGPIEFTVDPQDESICAVEDPIYFTTESTIGQGGLTTRWQVDEGAGWNDVVIGGIYSQNTRSEANVLTAIDSTYYDTLFISAAAANMDGFQYRNVANGNSGSSCGDVPSDESTLTVHGPIHIDVDPTDETICSGKPVRFVVETSNEASGEILYQWQKKSTTADLWVNLNNTTTTYNGTRDSILSISDVAFVIEDPADSAFFRVLITTSECNTIVYSDSALLKVEGPFVFGSLEDSPHDTIVCAGEQIIFNSNPRNDGFGTMEFEWQIAVQGGGFQPIAADPTLAGSFTGETSTQLIIDPTLVQAAYLDSSFFRLDVTSGVCLDETSSLRALLRVDGPLTFDLHPVDTVNCADKGVIFFADVRNDGYTGELGIQYRWQELDHETMVWRDIENEGVYNGASTDTLSIDITSGLDSNQYRLVAWSSVCNTTTSDAAYLIEEGSVSFVDHPDDVIICSGEMTSFTAISENSTGQGTNPHNWQISKNNGITWANIDLAELKDGSPLYTYNTTAPMLTADPLDSTVTTITTTLNINDVEGLGGFRYRAAAVSEFCDTIFSQLAKLTVEGPFTADLTGPATVCANIGVVIQADVVNEGSGLPLIVWQYREPSGAFRNIPADTLGGFSGVTTNGVGFKYLTLDSVLYENSRANLPTTDTLFTYDGWQFRIAITSDTCEVESFSDTFTLNVVADTIGMCDWDLDGMTNLVDLDDDNDGLTDSIELYITTGPGSEPQDSIAQFDTDTDNNMVSDDEEDADEDTISNGEEVDDDDGNGDADGVNTTTGGFDGFPANPNPTWEDPNDVFNGDPLDPCDPILSPACIGVVLDINVKLQGAMPSSHIGAIDPDGSLMRDDLRSKNMLPLLSPYSGLNHEDDQYTVYNTQGQEVLAFEEVLRDKTIDSIPFTDSTAIFGPNGRFLSDPGNAVVDWVFVEIRSGIKLDSIISTRAALLQRDGDVRDWRIASDSRREDVDGFAYLAFDSTLAGEYYVSVRHRNHLGVMTNEAGLFSPIVTHIDFTEKEFNALGIHSMRFNRDTTEQYMWAGDINSDRKVIYQGPNNDVDEMFFKAIAAPGNDDGLDNYIVSGYNRTDYNMDGNSIFQGPKNDRQMLIFQSILQFPDNKLKRLANYVILEQLP